MKEGCEQEALEQASKMKSQKPLIKKEDSNLNK
jgi:hypothetical protein